MHTTAHHTQMIDRRPGGDATPRKIVRGTLRKLEAIGTSDSLTTRLAGSCTLAAAVLSAAYVAARLALDLSFGRAPTPSRTP